MFSRTGTVIVLGLIVVLRAYAQQNPGIDDAKATLADPLQQVTNGFPGSIKFDAKLRVLEFCPDGAGDGFVASRTVSVPTLKDFGYLYIYFFSGYSELPEWRKTAEARTTAERVLSRPEYRKCKSESSIEAARCVLLNLSQNGAIKLVFVRYDEGKRNVVPENIVKELSGNRPPQ